jgi:hypothetical protein
MERVRAAEARGDLTALSALAAEADVVGNEGQVLARRLRRKVGPTTAPTPRSASPTDLDERTHEIAALANRAEEAWLVRDSRALERCATEAENLSEFGLAASLRRRALEMR